MEKNAMFIDCKSHDSYQSTNKISYRTKSQRNARDLNRKNNFEKEE